MVTRCVVSFTDNNKVNHSVEIHADSLYDAVIEAYQRFQEYNCTPGMGTHLDVEVQRPTVKHTIQLRTVTNWAHSTAKNAQELLAKERAKKILPRAPQER